MHLRATFKVRPNADLIPSGAGFTDGERLAPILAWTFLFVFVAGVSLAKSPDWHSAALEEDTFYSKS